jgi:hypothetical protein
VYATFENSIEMITSVVFIAMAEPNNKGRAVVSRPSLSHAGNSSRARLRGPTPRPPATPFQPVIYSPRGALEINHAATPHHQDGCVKHMVYSLGGGPDLNGRPPDSQSAALSI